MAGETAQPEVGGRPFWMQCAGWFVVLVICVGFWVGVAFGLGALF